MNRRKKPIKVDFNYQQETHEEKMIKFYVKRLIEIADDADLIWQITKDPDNIFRLTDEELTQVLKRLEEKVKNQELTQEVFEKIIAAINREK